MAGKLNVPHCRVHKAVKILEEKGLLYTVHGSGTFVAEPTVAPQTPGIADRLPKGHGQLKRIGIRPPSDIAGDVGLARAIPQAVEALRDLLPFMQIELLPPPTGTATAESAEIEIVSCFALSERIEEFAPLDGLNAAGGELVDGAAEMGTFGGVPRGVPLLWTSGVVYGDLGKLARYGVGEVGAFSNPSDIFKAGLGVEDKSGGTELGTKYRGFICHAAHYGVVFSHEGDRFVSLGSKRGVCPEGPHHVR